MQGGRLVCGNPGHGVGPLQHIHCMPVLAAAASGGWRGLLYTLLGPHHWQCHVLCSAGQPIAPPALPRMPCNHRTCSFDITNQLCCSNKSPIWHYSNVILITKLAAQAEMFIRLVQSSELSYLLPEVSQCTTMCDPLLKSMNGPADSLERHSMCCLSCRQCRHSACKP